MTPRGCLTMTLWRRPDYTRQALESLKSCIGINEYDLIIGINPDKDTVDELTQMALAVNFCRSCTVLVHSIDIGCNLNKKDVLGRAFADHDYVIQFDDDVLLAPDTLQYFEWAKQFEPVPEIFTVSAWRHAEGWLPGTHEKPHLIDTRISRQAFFSCYCWATWRSRWEEMRAAWPEYNPGPYFDEVLCTKTRGARYEVCPFVSRAINIGVDRGLHDGTAQIFPYWADSLSFEGGTFTWG